MVTAVQGLGRMVGGLQRQVLSLQQQLIQATAHTPVTLNTPASSSPLRASPPRPASSTPSALDASSLLASALQEPSPPQPPPPVKALGALGSLLSLGGGSSPTISIAGEKAPSFYLERMAKGGSVPALANKQERNKAETCMKFFNAMANAEERSLLMPPPPAVEGQPPPPKPDNGPRRVLVDKLHGLVLAKLIDPYEHAIKAQAAKREKAATTAEEAAVGKVITVPRDFLKADYLLPVSGISSHVEALKISVESSLFKTWREEYERREPARPNLSHDESAIAATPSCSSLASGK